MVSNTVKGILQDLGSLSRTELATIRSAINFLQSEDDTVEVANEYRIPFAALSMQLEVAGIRDKTYYQAFKSSAAFKNWIKSIKDLESFIEDRFPKLKESEKRALYGLMYKLLIAVMQKQKMPMTMATVASNTSRCQEVLNTEFPEYIQSGLGHLIISAMTEKGKG